MVAVENFPQSFGQSGKQGIPSCLLFLSESSQEIEATWIFIAGISKPEISHTVNGGIENQREDSEATQRLQKEAPKALDWRDWGRGGVTGPWAKAETTAGLFVQEM